MCQAIKKTHTMTRYHGCVQIYRILIYHGRRLEIRKIFYIVYANT